ncbi:MAG: sugar phosphate nucleotidyltransferase [Chloroflexi bacterium]|nr:sugar phosphate nucleotidyltransferase [Chloroflexota bacterium]
MKVVIFAGGSGRRLWPLSRQKSPKQFEPIIGAKSTLQLAVDRVLPVYGGENIFISTNLKYVDLVRGQLPEIPLENVIGEPARRDLAPAVGLAMMHLAHASHSEEEPIAILWGDNYMAQVDTFRDVLAAAESLLIDKKRKSSSWARRPVLPMKTWAGLVWAKNWDGWENGRFTALIP